MRRRQLSGSLRRLALIMALIYVGVGLVAALADWQRAAAAPLLLFGIVWATLALAVDIHRGS